jgi:TPR repeat protein
MPKLEAAPGLAKPDTGKAKETAPAAPPTPDASAPAEGLAAAKAAAPSEPRLSAAETAALLSRGDAAFGVGDIASARLFYERAADAGNGEAALRLGESYDPNFLERAKLRAIKGDPKAAAVWYRRAKELGIAEADILLKGIQTK